jgi:hypothetical protein
MRLLTHNAMMLLGGYVLVFVGAGEGIRTLDPNLGKAPALSAKLLAASIFSIPHFEIAHVLPKLI